MSPTTTRFYLSKRRLQLVHGIDEQDVVNDIIYSCNNIGYVKMKNFTPPHRLQPVSLNLGHTTPCLIYPRVMRLTEQEGFNYLLNNPDKINADNIALFDRRIQWVTLLFAKGGPMEHKHAEVVARENEERQRRGLQLYRPNCSVYLRAFSYEMIWILHHRRGIYTMAREMMPDIDWTDTRAVLDHLCHRPTCCNIEHLKLTTVNENSKHLTTPKHRRNMFEIDRAFRRLDSIEEKLDALIEVLGNRTRGKTIATIKF